MSLVLVCECERRGSIPEIQLEKWYFTARVCLEEAAVQPSGIGLIGKSTLEEEGFNQIRKALFPSHRTQEDLRAHAQ